MFAVRRAFARKEQKHDGTFLQAKAVADTQRSVIMDMTYSMLYIDYFNNSISNGLVGMILVGATDSFIDILQTILYFSPTAQKRVRTGDWS